MHLKKNLSLTILLLAVCHFLTQAQESPHVRYSVNEGMPSSEAYSVLQDKKGYIWVSTDAGVVRFNGYAFKQFTTQHGLTDNTVFGLYEDRLGRIWCRTLSGRICYFKDEKIYPIPANDSLSELARINIMTSLVTDGRDNVYITLTRGMYLKIAPPYGTNNITCFKLPGAANVIVSDVEDNAVFSAINRNSTTKLNELTVLTKRDTVKVPLNKPSFQNSRIIPAGTGGFYLGIGNHILSFANGRIRDSVSVKGLIISLFRDHKGNLLVGTLENGVYLFHKGWLQDPNRMVYLPKESISHICSDSEGSLWMTSLKNGLYYFPNPQAIVFKGENEMEQSIGAITQTEKKVITGKSNSEIEIIDPVTYDHERIEVPRPTEGKLEANMVNNFFYAGHDSLFIMGSRAMLFDLKNRKAIFFRKKMPIFLKDFGRYKNEWVGCGTYDLSFFKKESEIAWKEQIFHWSPINNITIDDTCIWVAATSGLWCYQGSIFCNYGDTIPYFKERIEDVQVLPDGEMILTTKANGILLWKRPGHQVTRISTEQGLPSNTCKKVFVESPYMIWVTTNQGIAQVDLRKKKVIRTFSLADGLPSNEVSEVMLAFDQIWVATRQGLWCMPIGDTAMRHQPPPVYLDQFIVNDKVMPLKGQPVQLAYNQNLVEFKFIGIAYKTLGKTHYKYRLKGADENWVYTSNHFVRYNSLPAGNYTFEVYAINQEGRLSVRPARFSFVIHSPFWETWWFITFVALLLILIIAAVFRARIKRIRRRDKEKLLYDRQLVQIEMKALRAQMNPHFIFNAINSIQHFILLHDNPSAQKYLIKFSRLIRRVLDHSKSDAILLSDELDTIQLYVDIEALRFDETLVYKVQVEEGIELHRCKIPPMLLQPFVENAIWHGLLPKQGERRLNITVMREHGNIVIQVEDNGIGRKEAKQKSAYDVPKQKSYGLEISYGRVEAFNYIYRTNMDLRIIDKTDAEGQPAGTLVKISIPNTDETV